MADITSAELQPVFKIGQTELAFPSGVTDPEVAKSYFADNYPPLRHSTIREPEVRGDKLVYEVEKAPVRTKG